MAFTLEMLDAVESAIAGGYLSVTCEGKSVSYRSLDDLLKARTIMRVALGLAGGTKTHLVGHDRGFGSGGSG
jgi:hypothetical protein